MRRTLLIAALLGLMVSPLGACINDSATKLDEQQFVSSYDPQTGITHRQPVQATVSTFHPGSLLFLLPSIALIGIGIFWLRQERQLTIKRQQRAYRQATR